MTTSQAAAVELFSTSILSNHKIRSRHERYISILSVKKIPYVYHDLAGDEEAKSRWRRKARDPQIPGLLVHNEWRGTFEEFEESIEFGELDLFLKIDENRTQKDAEAGLAPSLPDLSASTSSQSNLSIQSNGDVASKAAPRVSSHTVATLPRLAQPRAPSQANLAPALPFAPSGSGSRKEHDAESFLASLGISDLNLTEEELNEILEEGKDDKDADVSAPKAETETKVPSTSGERGQGKYPNSLGLGTSKPAVPRMYIPSAEAGIKPLRLARMGDGNQRSATATEPLRLSPSARFNASQLSSKALAAEAQASISSRSFSSIKLREAVSKGDKLEDAFHTTRAASNTNQAENVVGREDLDDLMASLGLGDVKMTEEEAEAFLLDGTIPTGLDSHGSRLGRAGSIAERARNEAAARDIAKRAKEKGFGNGTSRPSSQASLDDEGDLSEAKVSPNAIIEDSPASEGEEIEEKKAKPVEIAAIEEKNVPDAPKDEDVVEAADTAAVEEKSLPDAQTDEEVVEAAEIEKEVVIDPIPSSDNESAKVDPEATPKVEQLSIPPTVYDASLRSSASASESMMTAEEGEDVEKTPEVLSKSLEDSHETTEEATSTSDAAKVDSITKIDQEKEISLEATPAMDNSVVILPTEGEDKEPTVVPLAEKEATTVQQPVVEDAKPALEEGDHLKESQVLAEPFQLSSPASTVANDKEQRPQSTFLDASIFAGLSSSPDVHLSLNSPVTASEQKEEMSSPVAKSPPPANLSPIMTRRPLRSPSMTPSRRGLDFTRKISSSSLSEAATSPTSRVQMRQGLTSPPPLNLNGGSDNVKSPKSGAKKFFSIGRRKDRRSSSRRSEASDSEEEIISTISPSSKNDRSQKTLSMILREADEAMMGEGDENEEWGERSNDTAGLEQEGLDEDDGIEVAAR